MHNGLRDLRQLGDDRFDLAQLNAIAAHLHLRVDTPVKLDLVLIVDQAEVTGPDPVDWSVSWEGPTFDMPDNQIVVDWPEEDVE